MKDIPGIGILAGGRNRRMGRNKALLPVQGETMLQRLLRVFQDYPEVTVSAACPGSYEAYGRPVVYDEDHDTGPLEGICRILEHSKQEYVFVCAVDMPFIDERMVSWLTERVREDEDCVCFTLEGRIQPLCALYAKKALPVFLRQKEAGCYRLRDALQLMRTRCISLEESPFSARNVENMNYPEDYRRLCGQFVFCVSGIKNSGKTGLIERLIPLFAGDGFRVGVIKHDGHEFEIDHEGTDSFRFSRAGALVSAVYSGSQYAVISRRPPRIEELLAHCGDTDVVIIEGLKDSDHPKVEVLREVNHNLPVCRPETRICLAADHVLPDAYGDTPQYDLNDTEGIYSCIREFMENRS